MEESSEQRTNERDLLHSIRYRVSDIAREIQRNHDWHVHRAEEEDRKRELRKIGNEALDRRVRSLERNKYFVLGGMAVILALVKLLPALIQWFTKP